MPSQAKAKAKAKREFCLSWLLALGSWQLLRKEKEKK
jgi:hypothetical protein